METITIPYNDYKELLTDSMMYRDMNRELQFILRNCEWNKYGEKLDIERDLYNFMIKYIPNDVAKRESIFIKENEKRESESEK